MQTVIVRLSAPSGDGKLHGLVEVVGRGSSVAFTDDGELLALLHAAGDTTSGRHSIPGRARTRPEPRGDEHLT